LAAQFQEAAVVAKVPKYRVLTDLTGDFNRVILEYEAENLSEFEARMKDYATNEAFREKMKGYAEIVRYRHPRYPSGRLTFEAAPDTSR